jgi:hypothetical protein
VFSLVSTSWYLSDDEPIPTLTRTPGNTIRASRNWSSICCFLSLRTERCLSWIESVALRTSAAPVASNALPPEAPPPIAVYTSVTSGFSLMMLRACSAKS